MKKRLEVKKLPFEVVKDSHVDYHLLIQAGIKADTKSGINQVFEEFIRSTSFSIIILDSKGRIEFVNPSAKRILGCGDEDIIHRHLGELHTSNLSRILSSKLINALAVNEHCVFEIPYQSDNEVSWLECLITIIRSKNDSAPHVFIMIGDITRRKDLDIQILKAKRELEATIDNLPLAVAICGTDFRVRRVNKSLAHLYDMAPWEMVGGICYELLHKIKQPYDFCPFIRKSVVTYPHIFRETERPESYFSSVSPMDGKHTCCSYIVYKNSVQDAVRTKNPFPTERSRELNHEDLKKAASLAMSLSKREIEILQLIVSGMSNKDISEHLFLSVKTVETHRSRIMKKFKVHKSTSLIVKALEYKLV